MVINLGPGAPMVDGLVSQNPVRFMVDTGATVSTIGNLNHQAPPLSSRTLTTMGFSGIEKVNPFTTPCPSLFWDKSSTTPSSTPPTVPLTSWEETC